MNILKIYILFQFVAKQHFLDCSSILILETCERDNHAQKTRSTRLIFGIKAQSPIDKGSCSFKGIKESSIPFVTKLNNFCSNVMKFRVCIKYKCFFFFHLTNGKEDKVKLDLRGH